MDLANCLGVNWLICGDFEPVDASAKCLLWFQKMIEKHKKFRKAAAGKRILVWQDYNFRPGSFSRAFSLALCMRFAGDFWRGWKKKCPPLDPASFERACRLFCVLFAGLRDRKQMSCCVTHMQIARHPCFSFYYFFLFSFFISYLHTSSICVLLIRIIINKATPRRRRTCKEAQPFGAPA